MKKLMLSLAVVSALGLMGCDDETIEDIQNENAEMPVATTTSRVKFDPANSDISVPNDLIFKDTLDGTLNFPVPDATDFSDPLVAANALDGWSTSQPFPLSVIFDDGVALDADSLFAGGAVGIFEVGMGASRTDADCAAVPQGVACKPLAELTFGEDYIIKSTGDSILVVPLKPLKAKTTYIVALTSRIKDSNGMPIAGSSTYELVKQDINEKPFADETLYTLQSMVNSFEGIAESFGMNKDEIIYTMAMTTQSIDDTLQVTKKLLAASLNPETALFATPVVMTQNAGITAATALGILPDPEDMSAYALYSSANIYGGSVTIPNYLGVPSAANPLAPTNVPWQAKCDSGATLAGVIAALGESAAQLIPATPVDQNDAECMALSQGLLRDTSNWDLSAAGIATPIDTERNLTKFNAIPKRTEMQTLDVQMTTPNKVWADQVRASFGMEPLVMPPGGWPVVILQHGITSKKENMLSISGFLSVNGFATIAIDHPLHNSRGYDLDQDGTNDIDAVSNPFAYLNIASLLNMRDNLRQSTTDSLALRVGINFMAGDLTAGVDINPTQVSYLGHSLGAMTGVNFLALANDDNIEGAGGLFAVQNASLAMPGAGGANFIFESKAFGNLVKANLAHSLSPEFAGFAASVGVTDPEGLGDIWPDFVAALDDSATSSFNDTFALYTFAAQTITDSADMLNYAGKLRANGTPLHIIEVVGDGVENTSDHVIPNVVSTHPLSGTEPLIAMLGVGGVTETVMSETPISGAVRFIKGHHGSLLDPSASVTSPDPVASFKAMQEMQMQVSTYFASEAKMIVISEPSVVLK